MKQELLQRTKSFAHETVDLALQLPNTYLGNHIKGQLIRSATSVAANYRAACLSQSRKTFVAKLSIVIEEADECIFWIEFALDRKLLSTEKNLQVFNEAKELTSIFIASRKTISIKNNQ